MNEKHHELLKRIAEEEKIHVARAGLLMDIYNSYFGDEDVPKARKLAKKMRAKYPDIKKIVDIIKISRMILRLPTNWFVAGS